MRILFIIMWSESQINILPYTYLITVALIIILTALLKNKSIHAKTIPLGITSIIMTAGEIAKISFCILKKEFTAWQLPFHYCSLFIPWFFLCCFFTKKTRRVFYALSFSMGIPVIAVLLIFPGAIFEDSTDILFKSASFCDYHNFFYHILIIFFIGLMLSFRLYKPKIKDLKYVLICFYIWAAIATIFSNILNQSYANLLHSDFKLLEKIRLNSGYYLYLLFLYASGYIAVAGTFLLSVFVSNISIRKRKNV